MWPFTRKYALQSSGFLRGMTDWHCHILPGVDDGFRSMEESLEALDFYAELGITQVWLTPHIMEDIPNTPEGLRARFDELRSAYQGPVRLHLAAEHMLDTLFEERMEAGELMPMGADGDTLLVETSYFNPPMDLYGLLERIKQKGYKPLLAHPERYVYMDMSDYRRLRGMGVELQLNLMSLFGLYGQDARAKSMQLLREGYYGRAGTDLHRLRPLKSVASDKVLTGKQIESLPKYVE